MYFSFPEERGLWRLGAVPGARASRHNSQKSLCCEPGNISRLPYFMNQLFQIECLIMIQCYIHIENPLMYRWNIGHNVTYFLFFSVCYTWPRLGKTVKLTLIMIPKLKNLLAPFWSYCRTATRLRNQWKYIINLGFH